MSDEELTPKQFAAAMDRQSVDQIYEWLKRGIVPGAYRFPPDTGPWRIPAEAVKKIKNGDV